MISEEYLVLFREKAENLRKFVKAHVYDNIDKDKITEFVIGECPEMIKEKAKEELETYDFEKLINEEVDDTFIKTNLLKIKFFMLLVFLPVIKEEKLEKFVAKILESLEFKGDADLVVGQLCKYICFFSEMCGMPEINST